MSKHSDAMIVNINRVDVISAINNHSSFFSEPEKRCAAAILENPELVSRESITEFARRAQTSEATVVRFCKKVGFTGYPNLRLSLVATLGFRAGSGSTKGLLEFGITQEDTTEELLEKIAFSSLEAIRLTSGSLDARLIDDVVRAIEAAPTVGAYGAGASGLIASDLQMKLNRVGKPCLEWTNSHMALNAVAALAKNDVLFIISHSGETADSIAVATEFKARGVKIALITNAASSTLAEIADYVLHTHAEKNLLRVGTTVSRLAQLYVVDCIALALVHNTWETSKEALSEAQEAVGRHITYRNWLYQESSGEKKQVQARKRSNRR